MIIVTKTVSQNQKTTSPVSSALEWEEQGLEQEQEQEDAGHWSAQALTGPRTGSSRTLDGFLLKSEIDFVYLPLGV